MVLNSRFEHEIERINIYQDRFLVGNTAHTLMLGDLDSCCLSEIAWESTGAEKYYFDTTQVRQETCKHSAHPHAGPFGQLLPE